MDFLKKAATDFAVKSALESSESKTATNAAAPEGNEQKPKQEQDYGDKAFDMITKKLGHDLSPETDEKITDALRTGYEKFSGKKVDPKYSN